MPNSDLLNAWVHKANRFMEVMAHMDAAPALFTEDYQRQVVEDYERCLQMIDFWSEYGPDRD